MFFGKGIRLGRISGIEISLDYSWFIIFGILIFMLGMQMPALVGAMGLRVPAGMPSGAYWGMAVLISLLFFASVLGHELAHAFIARRAQIPINSITLFLFGGMAQMEDEPGSPWDEFKMAIAGPIASLGFAVLFFGLAAGAATLKNVLFVAGFSYLAVINLVLAVFNMLPGFPMDGGRVFRALVWRITGSLRRSTRIASVTGQTFGVVFIVLGLGGLVYKPLEVFGTFWLALVGWFLITAARSSYQQVVMRETLSQVPVRTLMNPQVEAVPATLSVERLVTDYFMRESAWTLPVERDDRLIGMVTVEDVRGLARDEWPRRLVGEIVRPIEDAQLLRANEDAWHAANRMSETKADRLLVADEHDGHVEGILTRGAIMRWLEAHTRMAPGTA